MLLQKLNLVVLLLTLCQIANILAQEPVPIKCYKCDSTVDVNCIKNVTAIGTIDGDPAIGCYTQIDDTTGKVIRDIATATQTEGPSLKICKTPLCNNNNICKNCDSSVDKKCAQTNSVDAKNELCTAGDTKCLIMIKEKITYRRCATADDLKACDSPSCTSCTLGNCNIEIFPTNRIRCYQCASEDSTCVNVIENSEKQKSLPCGLYDEKDTCYTFATAANYMTRGCVSDKDNKCSTPESQELCATCGTDNCNGQMYSNAQKLLCITCNSNVTAHCQWAQSPNTAIACTKPVQYNKKEQCYIQNKDGVVHRGCFSDRDIAVLGETCGPENTCETCSSQDGCNNRDSANFTCIRCRSDDSSECRKGGDKMVGEKCVNPVTEANAKCYFGTFNNIAIRGCLVDVNEQMLAVCIDPNSKQCETCIGADCNKKEISGAATVTISTVLLSIAALFAMWH